MAEPVAEPGNLCVFAEAELNTVTSDAAVEAEYLTTFGFTITGVSKAAGLTAAWGTWAVAGN